MIQMVKTSVNDSDAQPIRMPYVDLASNGKPLVEFVSHQTGNSTTAISPTFGENDRYSSAFFRITITPSSDTFRRLGYVYLGFDERPMGFYDVIVYDNNDSSTNLDPTGLTVLWRGLGNLTAQQTGTNKFPAVEYTDYDTNDADTESVYITFGR